MAVNCVSTACNSFMKGSAALGVEETTQTSQCSQSIYSSYFQMHMQYIVNICKQLIARWVYAMYFILHVYDKNMANMYQYLSIIE